MPFTEFFKITVMRPRGNFIESNIAEAKEVVVLVQHMSTNLCLSQNNTGQVKFYDEIFQAKIHNNEIRFANSLKSFQRLKERKNLTTTITTVIRKLITLASRRLRESPQYQLRMRILLGRVVLDLRSKFKYNEHESLTVVN